MAPTKPALRPLKTSKHMAFPSELYYSPGSGCRSDTSRRAEDGSRTSLSPPPSYTEFLKALTPVFSPASPGASFTGYTSPSSSSSHHLSPMSIPSSTTSATFPASSGKTSRKERQKQRTNHLSVTASLPPASPVSAPLSARPSALTPAARGHGRLRPPPPYKPYQPLASFVDNPRSAASASVVRSPYSPPELRVQYVESPRGVERSSSSSTPSSLNFQHVVTTTVTFKRSPPLGPPPKGKKRRTRESGERRYD